MVLCNLEEKHSAFALIAGAVFKELWYLNKELINPYRAVARAIHFAGIGNGASQGVCDGRERDGEHAFQVGIIAVWLNERWNLRMDSRLLRDYADWHDVPEVFAGETPAFQPYDENGHRVSCPTHKDKEKREKRAMTHIRKKFAHLHPRMVAILEVYNRQGDEEGRFIYALDKFVACLNIVQDKGRTNLLHRITLEDALAYKRPRVARHPVVRLLYAELEKEMRAHPDYFWQGDGNVSD